MLYSVAFEIDNGTSYENDTAVVAANDVWEAEVKLRNYINSLDSETCVSKIYNIRAFEGDVWTGRHGYRR
jgi:hypothetical protein